MKKLFVVLVMVAALAGCASFDQLQGLIADKGKAASAEARETSEFVLCRGISVGEAVRAYFNTPERAHAWGVLCSYQVQNVPVLIPKG